MNSQRFVLVLWLCFTGIGYGANDFRISTFDCGERGFPVPSNSYIQPDSGAYLSPADLQAVNRSSFVMRRRYGPDSYCLYQGVRTADAAVLCAFRLPEGLDLDDFLHVKLYNRELFNPAMDISTVYFGAGLLYVENAVRVYYFDNGWRTLSMLREQPATLLVESVPPNARIFRDGEELGTTPMHLGPLFRRSILLTVRLDGYASQEVFVSLLPGQSRLRTVALVPETATSDITPRLPHAGGELQSLFELCTEIETVEKDSVTCAQTIETVSAQWEEQYVPLEPKGEFETASDFAHRKAIYEALRTARREELQAQHAGQLLDFAQRLYELRRYRKRLESRPHHRGFDNAVVKFGSYNADKGAYDITMDVNDGDHRFNFEGTADVPVCSAEDLRRQNNSAPVHLYYRLVSDRTSDHVRILYVYTGLRIEQAGIEHVCRGELTFGDSEKQLAGRLP